MLRCFLKNERSLKNTLYNHWVSNFLFSQPPPSKAPAAHEWTPPWATQLSLLCQLHEQIWPLDTWAILPPMPCDPNITGRNGAPWELCVISSCWGKGTMEESPPLFSPKACRSAVTLLWGNSLLMPTLCSIPRDRCRIELEIEEHQFSSYGLLEFGVS